jgi:HPr kinase/phosphorylase
MTAQALLDERALTVGLTLLAGSTGTGRIIDHTRIQKSGLALAGHFHGIVRSRIQILGQTEQSYVNELDAENRRHALEGFFGLGLSAVILTGTLGPSTGEMMAHAEATGTPLLHSAERSSVTITGLHALLDERLAPRQRLHGVLIDVFGVGLLIVGSSGVGKSECALDLVMRGHRLVADDVVECDYRPPGMIFGAPAHLLRHLLEVRGLGILNIKDLFGVTAIRERKRIDVVARLAEEGKTGEAREAELDRLGLDERFHSILGVAIPELVIPVRPGRDMASILEVAARNELLKNAGHHATRELFGAIESAIDASSELSPIPPQVALPERDPPPPSSDPSYVAFSHGSSAPPFPAAPRAPSARDMVAAHRRTTAASTEVSPALDTSPKERTTSSGTPRAPSPLRGTKSRPVRPPVAPEHAIDAGTPHTPSPLHAALVGRSDESELPPPVGGGPWLPPRRR